MKELEKQSERVRRMSEQDQKNDSLPRKKFPPNQQIEFDTVFHSGGPQDVKPQRELSLGEYVSRLSVNHRARKQLDEINAEFERLKRYYAKSLVEIGDQSEQIKRLEKELAGTRKAFKGAAQDYEDEIKRLTDKNLEWLNGWNKQDEENKLLRRLIQKANETCLCAAVGAGGYEPCEYCQEREQALSACETGGE